MKKSIAALGLAASAALLAAPSHAAITLVFAPSATQVAVGEAFTIDVSISGLGADILSGYDLNFVYAAAVLNWSGSAAFQAPFGSWLDGNNGLPNGDLGYDLTSLETDASLAASQADSFQLFSFSLVGAANGSTTFTLGADADFQRLLVGANATPLAVDIGSVCIAVGTGSCTQAVPEPASFGLAGLALFGAFAPAAWRRRKSLSQRG
jgi:MYXO-CTERM domain-containing protein